MHKTLIKLGAIALASSILLPINSYATNGYFLIGYGAKSRGMGGVGVAKGQDGLAAAFNPATMGDVGSRFDIGFDYFRPVCRVSHTEGTLSETVIKEDCSGPSFLFGKDGNYIIPNMGGTWQIKEKMTLGFAFVGNGAAAYFDQSLPPGNSSYFFNFNGLGGDDTVGVDLFQAQFLPSISYKVHKQHTLGATLAIGMQRFAARGLLAFEDLNLAAGTDSISNEGHDMSYGAGIRLGWQGKFMEDKLVFGVNYSSRVYMTEFDKYKNLFAEQGSFDIPENYAIGVAYSATPSLDIMFDIQRINYSDVASVGNPGPNAYDTTDFNPLCPGVDPPECKLGGDQGMGFGWSDQTVYKLGLSYAHGEHWEFRGGLNYGETTIPDDQVLFNMLAPATSELHLTLGLTYEFSNRMELSGSYVHAFENTISGPTTFPPPGSDPDIVVDAAALSMKQDSLGVSLGWQF